jgi:hypothetical protein
MNLKLDHRLRSTENLLALPCSLRNQSITAFIVHICVEKLRSEHVVLGLVVVELVLIPVRFLQVPCGVVGYA